MRLYASIRNFYAAEAQALPDGRIPTEIQGIRLGSALLVGVPGELFVEIALRIKAATDHPLFIMGITNGYMGYLPNRDAYRAGGYEVVSAKVTEAAEDLLVAAIRDLDRRLFSEAASVSDAVRIGVVGLGIMGEKDVRIYQAHPGARVTAIRRAVRNGSRRSGPGTASTYVTRTIRT